MNPTPLKPDRFRRILEEEVKLAEAHQRIVSGTDWERQHAIRREGQRHILAIIAISMGLDEDLEVVALFERLSPRKPEAIVAA